MNSFIHLIIEQYKFGVTLQNSTTIELLLFEFESQCNRERMAYVKAVRCLFRVNPVDTLECPTGQSKNATTMNVVHQDAGTKRKGVEGVW